MVKQPLVEKDGVIKLGKSQFSVVYLQSVTIDEAVENLTNKFVHADRVRNAWKRANKKK
jgi:hypothetical protein